MEYLNGAITYTYKHRIFRVPGILFHKFNLVAPTFITITSKSCRQTPPQVLIRNLYISMHSMSPLSSHSNLPVLTSPPRVRRMATQQLSLFSSLLLMLLLLPFAAHGSNEASHEIKKTIDVVVEGVVYCQSCDHAGTLSLIGATPIEFGRVGVSCKDHKGRVSFYKVFTTDAYGYFYVPLQDFKMKHNYLDNPLQACTVHLLLSPHPQCNLLSNVNSGIDGSLLRYERKRLSGENYEVVLYAAGPLAFHPSNCPPKIN